MADDMSPKLYLSMILAETEPVEIVKRSIDSIFEQVDGLFITITYNKKKPAKNSKLYKFLKKEYQANISLFKWVDDFSAARNFALQQVPRGNNSYFIWQDADDVWMDPHLIPEVFEKVIETGMKSVFFPYWYEVELDDDGDVRQVLTEQKRERLVINDGSFKWIAPLHETLISQKQENNKQILLKEPVVVHLSDNKRFNKGIVRNVRILENTRAREIEEGNRDPRITMYLAKSYFDMAKACVDLEDRDEEYKLNIDRALDFFKEYLDGAGEPGTKEYVTPSGWAEERSTAWNLIAEIAMMSGDYNSAVDSYKAAIDESEKFPNYYVDLSFAYIKLNQWDKAKHYLTIGTNLDAPNTTITATPRDFELRKLESTIQIALHDQELEIAKKASERMVVLIPDNEKARERVVMINSLIIHNKACQSAVFLGKYLEQTKEVEKIPYLIKSFSKSMQQEKFVAEMKRTFLPPRLWAQNEISIVAGPGFEEWTPESLETGLGGSEAAIVHLSDELTKLGWMVTVYGNPGAKAGDFNGVEYKMWYEFNAHDEFNVLVLWRGIGFADVKPKAKFSVLWMHDVPNNPDFTKERVDSIDKIIVLSEFHKSLLRMNDNGEFKEIPEEKIWVSSNGIVDLKPSGNKRKKNGLIYASSPDRGLVYLLNNWERVKAEVPEATLDVYYGFNVFDAIHKRNPERLAWKAKIMKLMEQDGINYHGRIGHKELHEKYSEADIWPYSTDFEEISCISAMEAQTLGAIPFTTDYAALSETVKGGVKVDVDITDPEGQKEYFDELIKLMKDEDRKEDIRKPMMEFAKNYFQWSKVAETWSNVFNEKVRSQ